MEKKEEVTFKLQRFRFRGGAPPFRGYHFQSESTMTISASTSAREFLLGLFHEIDPHDLFDLEIKIEKEHRHDGSTFQEGIYPNDEGWSFSLESGEVKMENAEQKIRKQVGGDLKLADLLVGQGLSMVVYIPLRRGFCDIGHFGFQVESPGARCLIENDQHSIMEDGDLQSMMDSLHGSPDATFTTFPAILTPDQCTKLKQHVDLAFFRKTGTTNSQKDFKYRMELDEIKQFLDADQLEKLRFLFKGTGGKEVEWDEITLRRSSCHGKFINFHVDHALKTMNIPLNEPGEYEGGKLVYVTQQGLNWPKRSIGSGTIHDNRIIHGVSQLLSGVRYGLVFQLHSPLEEMP